MGGPAGQMGDSPLAGRIGEQMMQRRQDMRPKERPFGPPHGQQFGPQQQQPFGPQHIGPRRGQGEQFGERMQQRRTESMEKLAEEDPEKHELINKQAQLRDQLRDKIDELTDLLIQTPK